MIIWAIKTDKSEILIWTLNPSRKGAIKTFEWNKLKSSGLGSWVSAVQQGYRAVKVSVEEVE